MLRFVVNRLLLALPTLWAVLTLVFVLVRVVPGDPTIVVLGDQATPAARAALRERLGLDKPLVAQYADFMLQIARGDLGKSLVTNRPITTDVAAVLPYTIELTIAALIIGSVIGIPLGVVAALNRGNMIDRAAGTFAVLGIAMPSFWLGILLIYVFSVELGWLPSGRMGGPEHYVLPVVTLGVFLIAGFMRLVRSSMLEVMESEFVKLARIKGLSEGVVIWKHCLRNALIPVLTLCGVFVSNLITGAIVTETVFAWPGIGRLTYEAVIYRDFPLLQAVIILKSILILSINLGVDILYAYVDPRIRLA